ncbi:5-methylcytosine rRNA methyltransferase NSUN4 [Belonocnema kinseyi]|uniref:5-methylcytosine rRNA methyltransferase NSUN4 n=1 Tax=Belonocnema kinseyi TaxID=2817044 RepID=UPI00143D72D5|nr:5-methylcytosine rRNA methyltransferase NSUN4 [Belonocnema kinseyi]
MTQVFVRLRLTSTFALSARFKGHRADHWSSKAKKKPKDKALDHFDDFYQSVYGKGWPDIREALLQEKSKYLAVVNNFSDSERVREELESLGAIDLRSIYKVQKELLEEEEFLDEQNGKKRAPGKKQIDREMSSFLSKKQLSELESIYPADSNVEATSLREVEELKAKSLNELDENEGFDLKVTEPLQPVTLKSIESEVEIELDSSRIITPSSGLTLSALQEYIPATKLKGLEDFILESEHYSYYKQGSDFTVTIEKEPSMSIPKHLTMYTFEEMNNSRFKSAKRGSTGVVDYYLLDGGSVLPVLALDLQPGDRILDMCAAPGGKSFCAIQTLFPSLIVMNDVLPKRVKRIHEVIEQCLSALDEWGGRLLITQNDARIIEDKNVFNKILVDVPCTNDRHSLHSDDGNWFKSVYIKERLKLPELQTDILVNALKLVSVGGTVVYATCSLSPVQNDGVVQMALKKAFEEAKVVMVVKDISKGLKPLECLYNFGNYGLKYGHIVIPTMGNNWGPMYFCKMTRVK